MPRRLVELSARIRVWTDLLRWNAEHQPNNVGELLDRFRGSVSGRTWIQVTAHLLNTSSPRLRAALWDYVLEVGGCD